MLTIVNLLKKVSNHPLLSTASMIGVISGCIVPIYIAKKADAPATVDFALPIQSSKHDLFRGDSVTLTLSATNHNTGQSINADRYECKAGETPAGVAVQPVNETTCSFRLTNAVIAESNAWPVKVDFNLEVLEQSKPAASRSATIRFHDINRPLIDAASFRWVGTSLQVHPEIRPNRETATKIALCEWRPADLFMEAIIKNAGCTATFRPLPSSPLPPVSVVVTFQAGPDDKFSAPATEDTAILVPPWTPSVPRNGPASLPTSQETEAAILPTTQPILLPSHTTPHPVDAPAIPPNFAPTATPATLLATLHDTQGEDRYDHLAAGLNALPQAQRLTSVQVAELLGPLSGTLRSTALSHLLPYLQTPLPSPNVLVLLQGLASSDRADNLHTLAGCLAHPVDKPALLAGVYGSERAWVETALDDAGPCSLSPHAD